MGRDHLVALLVDEPVSAAGVVAPVVFACAVWAASVVLPGKQVGGCKRNGLLLFMLAGLVLSVGPWIEVFPATFAARHLASVAIGAVVVGAALSASGLAIAPLLSLRLAHLGWLFLAVSVGALQVAEHQVLSLPMMLHQLMVAYQVGDHFWHEQQAFGRRQPIMLNAAAFPLAFAVPAVHLLEWADMSPLYASVAFGVFIAGNHLYRSTLSQLTTFLEWLALAPMDRDVCMIDGQVAKTVNGRILASGFWGILRRPLVLGDAIMALGLCMPGNFTLRAYSFCIGRILWLMYRASTEERGLLRKFKKDWVTYCDYVPFVAVPGVW